ncbi:hypothetical protein VTK26DRAFT_5759 [Humicola hyalothermophila]
MPHDIFLAAVVLNPDVPKARALLGGFTEMRERHQFTRIQHYVPKDAVIKGFSNIKELQKERGPNAAKWQELHQILARQPSTLQVRTIITDEVQSSISSGEQKTIPADRPRLLRWTELPDPPSQWIPPFITQRKIVEIADQKVEKVLSDSQFKAVSNLVDESYHWWLNDVEYTLTRTFIAALDSSDQAASQQQVPNIAGLEPPADFWLLYVRSRVESTPERMQQAHAQLVRIREQLMGVFDFKVFDRRCHDSRVQPQGAQGPA